MKVFGSVIGIMLVLTSTADSWAQRRGGVSDGGGSPHSMRKAQIIRELQRMPERLKIIAALADPNDLDPTVREVFRTIVRSGLIADLSSPYKVVDSKLKTSECFVGGNRASPSACSDPAITECLVDGARAPAKSGMGNRGGEICFDIELLRDMEVTEDELVGLAFHEHAHHFEVLDASHFLAHSIAEAYLKLPRDRSGIIAIKNSSVCVNSQLHSQVIIARGTGSGNMTCYASWTQPGKPWGNGSVLRGGKHEISCTGSHGSVQLLTMDGLSKVLFEFNGSPGFRKRDIIFSDDCLLSLSEQK